MLLMPWFLRNNRVYGVCDLAFRKALVREGWDYTECAEDTYDLALAYMSGGEI